MNETIIEIGKQTPALAMMLAMLGAFLRYITTRDKRLIQLIEQHNTAMVRLEERWAALQRETNGVLLSHAKIMGEAKQAITETNGLIKALNGAEGRPPR